MGGMESHQATEKAFEDGSKGGRTQAAELVNHRAVELLLEDLKFHSDGILLGDSNGKPIWVQPLLHSILNDYKEA